MNVHVYTDPVPNIDPVQYERIHFFCDVRLGAHVRWVPRCRSIEQNAQNAQNTQNAQNAQNIGELVDMTSRLSRGGIVVGTDILGPSITCRGHGRLHNAVWTVRLDSNTVYQKRTAPDAMVLRLVSESTR
jgi:hypothetical protein